MKMFDSTFFPSVDKYITNGDKVSYTGILVASKLNQKNGQDYPLIDLVDIDFNGAFVSSLNAYLHTSYDLIYVLDLLNKSNEIGDINRQIEDILRQLQEIQASYVTYTSLDQVLQESWQRKLIPGDYIKIDPVDESDNGLGYYIYAYGLPTYEYLHATYSTIADMDALVEYIHNEYYDKGGTEHVAYQAAYDAILRVIDGADDAFDTLKEISDWILQQDRYTKVPWGDVVNDWKEDYYYQQIFDPETGAPTGKYEIIPSPDIEIIEVENPSYVKDNWKEDYWYELRDDGKYILVTDPDLIDESGETKYYYCPTQYYIKENYLTDIQNLIKRVNRLDDTVGFKEWDEYTNTYSYTGHCEDIYNLQRTDDEIIKDLENVHIELTDVRGIANTAYSTAYTAYLTANESYTIAYVAYGTANIAYDTANIAYDIAYDAIVKVGEPTKPAEYIKIESIEEAERLYEEGNILYYENEDGIKIEAELPLDPNKEYFIYFYGEPGTGLTGRVEVVEEKAEEALETALVALTSSYESLYHLYVNNDESTYVNLSLRPTGEFSGDRDRTIAITTDNASIDKYSGYVYSNGLVGLNTAFDIYTYASSWMMLYVDSDILIPEPTEAPIETPTEGPEIIL